MPAELEQPAEVTTPKFEVMPDNWRAVRLFCFSGTQWRTKADGRLAGLDYRSVETVLNVHRVPPRQRLRLLSDIQLIERGVLLYLSEKK